MRKNTKSFYAWCAENNKNYCDYWDYDLNKISPNDVSYSTKDKYYFKCVNGHESFLKGMNNLVNSKDLICPICNSFYTWCMNNNRNDLIEAWDDNKDIKYIPKCSGKKAWFKIQCERIEMRIGDIVNLNKGCDPIKKYYNSIGYYLISNYGEEAIEKYWSNKNVISPFILDKGSSKKIWIKCQEKEYHNDYQLPAYSFIYGCRCPMCASKIIHPKDSFAQYNIDRFGDDWLEKCWCDDNKVDPFSISIYKNKLKIHLKCKNVNYHDFYTTPATFDTHEAFCPYCGVGGIHQRTHKNDSFGARHPEVLKLWSDKNDKTPFEYSEYSHKKVWFKCDNNMHADYERYVSDYSVGHRLCPKCMASNRESSFEKSVREYIENDLKYTVLTERDCNCLPINPYTNMPLPFDNEIVEKKAIVEVHGIQHYEETGWHITQAKISGRTPIEEFEYQKWKDKFKKDYAIQQGYIYIEIPYWTIIDNSFKEIITNNIN